MALCAAAGAQAQVAGSASIQSDYRYRGVSLTGGKPAVSLSIAYDHESGLYAGVSAFGASGADNSVRFGATGYFGYVARVSPSTAWDLGVTHSAYEVNAPQNSSFGYTEIYTGIVKDHFSVHLHYSPDYFGQGASTVYVDLDGAYRPSRRWRLFGHVGLLTPIAQPASSGSFRERYDLRAGAAAEFARGEVQLALTSTGPDLAYPEGHSQDRAALVVAATFFF